MNECFCSLQYAVYDDAFFSFTVPRHRGGTILSFFLPILIVLLRHQYIGIFDPYIYTYLFSHLNIYKISSKQINIFLTGATGYIGGSILTGLLQHLNVSNFNITVLVRGDESRVKKLASLGVTPVIGTNESRDIIEKAASKSHVVIYTSNSADDLPSTRSIISGLNKRTHTTGKPVIYIHTSGTAVISEDVRGKKGSDTIYSDLDLDKINSVADENWHRDVDLLIINAAQANPQLKSVVVLPPAIHGVMVQDCSIAILKHLHH